MELTSIQKLILKEVIELFTKTKQPISYSALGSRVSSIASEDLKLELYRLFEHKAIELVDKNFFVPSAFGYALYIENFLVSKPVNKRSDDILKVIVERYIKEEKYLTIPALYQIVQDNTSEKALLSLLDDLVNENYIVFNKDIIELTEKGYQYYIEKIGKPLDLTNRQKIILKSIVEMYNASRHTAPISSSQFNDLPYLNYSSATIRYEMAALEELGYITKTHTSSGRIPTKKGYQYYLENLLSRDTSERNAYDMIDKILFSSNEKDETIKRVLDFISDFTSNTAFLVRKRIGDKKVKTIHLDLLDNNRVVVTGVMKNGEVKSELVNLKKEEDYELLKSIVDDVNSKEAINKDALPSTTLGYLDPVIKYIYESLVFDEETEDDVCLTGIVNILDDNDFMSGKNFKDVYELFNEREYLKYIPKENKLTVVFDDLLSNSMKNGQVISVPILDKGERIGTICVLGSYRVSYNKVIPLLEYLASRINKIGE